MDRYHPWHPDSRFSHLRELLIDFQEGLSRNLRYSPRNTETHIMYKNTLAPYSLMHIVYFLSVIVLHRAYLPFLPLRCSEPMGPLDDPSLPADRYNAAPDGFWRDSAREVFKAARQMMELVRVCRDRGVLMEIPLVGFAVYNAAFMGVYAAHFNHMDQEGYVCSKPNSTDVIPGPAAGGQGQLDVRRAVETLGEMRPRLRMAGGWFRTISRLHGYFNRVNNECNNRGGSRRMMDLARTENDLAVNGKTSSLSATRDDLNSMDRLFTDLGSSEDQAVSELNGTDDDIATGPAASVAEHGAPTSDSASNAVKSESGNDLDSHVDGGAGTRREPWVPVNSHSPNRGLFGKDGGDHARNNDLGPMHHRPIDNDRWPSLPPPQTTPGYNLPTIQPPPQHGPPSTPGASSCLPPPRAISPGPFNSSVSSALPPYLPTSSPSSNKLQPLQSWQTSRPQQAHSQSLPSLSAAAQHGFAMPPLPPSSSLHNPPAPTSTHPHPQHALISPPPGSRFDSGGRPSGAPAAAPAATDLAQANNVGAAGSLGGDDVIAFIAGESCEDWVAAAAAAGAAQVGGVSAGWLRVVWAKV